MRREADGEAAPPRKRTARTKPEHPMSAPKLEVLRFCALSHFLTAAQAAAMDGRSEKATRDHLRDLRHHQLLRRVAYSRNGIDRGPYLYVPTPAGLRLLQDAGMLPDPWKARQPGGITKIHHQVAVRDLGAWAFRCARENAASGHFVERWDCGESVSVGDLVPDAVLVYRHTPGEDGLVKACLVETDLGTERAMSGDADRWAAKIAGYGKAFADPTGDALFGAIGFERARLLVTVEDVDRAEWILRRIQGTELAPYVWITARGALPEIGPYRAIWLRHTGGLEPFLEEGG